MPILKLPNAAMGVNKDLTPEELPTGVWSDVQNMRFANGYAASFKGTSQLFATTSIVPYWLQSLETQSARYWVHNGLTSSYVDDSTTRTNISPTTAFTGTATDKWSGGVLGGILVCTNGVDQPHYWAGNPASKMAILPAWNSAWRCKVIKPFKNYLVALDITKSGTRYGSMVKWSHSAVAGSLPSSWDETDPTKDAGEQDLSETTDSLVDAIPLGDALIIYKERSCYSMRYVGAPYIFQFQRIPGNYGMLAKNCGVETPVGHVVLTSGDVVINTGQVVTSIADSVVRRHIFNTINTGSISSAFVASNPQKNEVLICYPEEFSTTCTKAAVWNWDTKVWGFRDLNNVTFGVSGRITDVAPGTWDSDTETWDVAATSWTENEYSPNESRLLLAESTRITAFDTSSSDDGVNPLTGTLERTGLSFDDPAVVKIIRAVFPRIDAPSGTIVTIEIGGSNYPNVPPTEWIACTPFIVGQSVKADGFATGKYLGIRITCNSPWRLRSFDIDVVSAGAY